MKPKWQHPDSDGSKRDYWRGFDELEDTPEFRQWLEREFPQGAAEVAGPDADDNSRRSFLKYMGASASLAGLAGCRRPEQFLVPFNEHVEGMIPGKALYYASARPVGEGCVPLVVATHGGRPTKVDGNRLHPGCSGGSDGFTQASVLDLYDPDRSRTFRRSGEESDAAKFEQEFLEPFKAGKGEKAALLVGQSSSPTRARLLEDLAAKFPALQVFEYEPLMPRARKEAELALWGEGVAAVPQFDKADRIFALDSDFLGLEPLGEDACGQWAKRRDPDKKMARLYVAEPSFTLTGGMADHRLRLASSQMIKAAVVLAEKLGLKTQVAPLAAKLGLSREALNASWIVTMAEDLLAAKGKAVVVAGNAQPKEVHILVGLINQALGAVGGVQAPLRLVRHGRKPLPGLTELATAIVKGDIETLISTTPADPVFDAPRGLDLGEALSKLKHFVHLGQRFDATGRKATWHVPATHYLESWGDVFSLTGALSVIQPMILPLYGGWSELDLFLKLLPAKPVEKPAPGAEPEAPAYAAVRETFAKLAAGGKPEDNWNQTLRDGFAAAVKPFAGGGSANAGAAAELSAVEMADFPYEEAIEVVLRPSSHAYDGRFVNNSWLMEAPDPITKLTWDNAALMSLRTADRLGVTHDGQFVSIKPDQGDALVIPAFRIPGHADYAITVAVGLGQQDIGRVGGGVGFDGYTLLQDEGGFIRTGATVGRTGGKYELAPTAIHWSMEGRAIVREYTKEDYDADPGSVKKHGMDAHTPPNISLYEGPDYFEKNSKQTGRPWQNDGARAFRVDENHQWGMTIDLNTCIGCNACTIACQAENNIPVVGKQQVIHGREMQWIRMDRYFSSPREGEGMTAQRVLVPETRGRPSCDDDAVEMVSQPVACMQCESAPCETVCPVNATVHTDDGLNAMTYNRCIGTRYCANNCPYKARRFNYFDYNKRKPEDFYLGPLAPAEGLGTTSLKLQKNPNVTVRMRGVIEKCTYCVQRIQKAKIDAKVEARDSDDIQVDTGAITTACQDACPSQAIAFGNLRNSDEAVTKLKDNPRNYDLLQYIGIRPRTSYLARVRNPNPKMPGAEYIGQATAHMH